MPADVASAGFYGIPGPQSAKNKQKATREWNHVQTLVHKAHTKGRTVVVAGDYNMTYNTQHHKHKIGPSQVQTTMLHSAETTQN